jgi:hypothetical protein
LQVARNAIWREVLKKEENVAPADNEFRMDPNKLMALTQTPQSMDPTKLLANVDNHEVKEKVVCVCVCVCAVSPRNVKRLNVGRRGDWGAAGAVGWPPCGLLLALSLALSWACVRNEGTEMCMGARGG